MSVVDTIRDSRCYKVLLQRAFLAISCLVFSGCSLLGQIGIRSNPGAEAQAELEDSITAEEYQRLKRFSHSLPVESLPAPRLMRTPEVDRELRGYLRGDARTIREALQRKQIYSPVLSQVLIDEGIPLELLNLALVESCFEAQARSPVGAVGLWQFMKSTALLYGLEVDLFKDQRKDPILATIAAARHLRDLYNRYSDWYLALAAYNAGSGAVNRALRQSGESDFWRISRQGYLNRQTREFIPRFIAASLIAADPNKYGVFLQQQ